MKQNHLYSVHLHREAQHQPLLRRSPQRNPYLHPRRQQFLLKRHKRPLPLNPFSHHQLLDPYLGQLQRKRRHLALPRIQPMFSALRLLKRQCLARQRQQLRAFSVRRHQYLAVLRRQPRVSSVQGRLPPKPLYLEQQLSHYLVRPVQARKRQYSAHRLLKPQCLVRLLQRPKLRCLGALRLRRSQFLAPLLLRPLRMVPCLEGQNRICLQLLVYLPQVHHPKVQEEIFSVEGNK